MSNCSNHRKDVHGETDMRHLAEEIGNLHYETLAKFLNCLSGKIQRDASADMKAGREQLARKLWKAKDQIQDAFFSVYEAWQICKPFMNSNEPGAVSSHEEEKKV